MLVLLPMYKGSNLNKFVSRTGSKIKNIGKGDGKFSTKFSNACDKLGNCFKQYRLKLCGQNLKT